MTDILTFTKPETRWLSNMAYVNIEHDGIVYPSTENFYQAMKYCKTDMVEGADGNKIPIRVFISKLTPSESKRFSKENRMTNVPAFDDNKIKIMRVAQRQKYSQEPFRSKLLATGDAHLEEGNWWKDSFWGTDIKTREGKNMLGRLIMQVRDELRAQENESAKTVQAF